MNDPYWEPENDQDVSTLPRRPLREELVGCLGIAGVLLLIPLLWLAFGSPITWVQRFIPLVICAGLGTCAALMMRVPGAGRRSHDPYRPLTRAGAPPIIERPATLAARVSFALGVALITLMAAAYAIAAIDNAEQEIWAAPVALLAGLGLLAQGSLVIVGRFSPPAIRWLRLTINGGAPHHGWLLVSVGLIGVSATLWLAMIEGYMWGFIGLALMLMAFVAITPFARRAPDPARRSESSVQQPKDVE